MHTNYFVYSIETFFLVNSGNYNNQFEMKRKKDNLCVECPKITLSMFSSSYNILLIHLLKTTVNIEGFM